MCLPYFSVFNTPGRNIVVVACLLVMHEIRGLNFNVGILCLSQKPVQHMPRAWAAHPYNSSQEKVEFDLSTAVTDCSS